MASVQDLLDALGDFGFTAGVTTKLRKINDAVKDISSRAPWSWLENSLTYTFDGTSATPTNFPSDFRASIALTLTDTGTALDWERADVVRMRYGAQRSQSGTPLLYYFEGRKLKVLYVPSSGTTLDQLYLRKHPTLVQSDPESAILIPESAHEVILLGAAYRLYQLDDDFDIATKTQADYESRIQAMVEESEVLQYQRPELVYPLDDYDQTELYL